MVCDPVDDLVSHCVLQSLPTVRNGRPQTGLVTLEERVVFLLAECRRIQPSGTVNMDPSGICDGANVVRVESYCEPNQRRELLLLQFAATAGGPAFSEGFEVGVPSSPLLV